MYVHQAAGRDSPRRDDLVICRLAFSLDSRQAILAFRAFRPHHGRLYVVGVCCHIGLQADGEAGRNHELLHILSSFPDSAKNTAI